MFTRKYEWQTQTPGDNKVNEFHGVQDLASAPIVICIPEGVARQSQLAPLG